jgi:hypothetical protein
MTDTPPRVSTRPAAPCQLCHLHPGYDGAAYCEPCIRKMWNAVTCPDCDSELALAFAADGRLLGVEVRHDDTCPTYQARQAAGQLDAAMLILPPANDN